MTSSISVPSTPANRSPRVEASRSDRSIGASRRDFGRRHLLRGADDFRRLLEQAADFVFGGIALQHLGENRLGAGETNELRILIERDAHGARLLGECLEHRLSHPPHGVRDELDALIRIEFPDGLEQAFVADGDELTQVESVALIFLDVGDDESEVGGHQSFRRFFVPLLRAAGEASLFFGVVDQRELLDVLQVLIERGGRRRSEVSLRRSGLGHLLHTRSFPMKAG